MKIFAIYAYENIYGGLHGMENHFFIEAKNLKEAEEEAYEASIHIIESYECIESDLLEETKARIGDCDEDDDEFVDCLNEVKEEDIAYEIWEMIENCPYTIEELNDMEYDNFDELVDKYGIKI